MNQRAYIPLFIQSENFHKKIKYEVFYLTGVSQIAYFLNMAI